jgi:hypothetical protein
VRRKAPAPAGAFTIAILLESSPTKASLLRAHPAVLDLIDAVSLGVARSPAARADEPVAVHGRVDLLIDRSAISIERADFTLDAAVDETPLRLSEADDRGSIVIEVVLEVFSRDDDISVIVRAHGLLLGGEHEAGRDWSIEDLVVQTNDVDADARRAPSRLGPREDGGTQDARQAGDSNLEIRATGVTANLKCAQDL